MRNTQESGQILRSKKRPRRTLRSGRGSRTNSNTSRQIPARVINAAYDTLVATDFCAETSTQPSLGPLATHRPSGRLFPPFLELIAGQRSRVKRKTSLLLLGAAAGVAVTCPELRRQSGYPRISKDCHSRYTRVNLFERSSHLPLRANSNAAKPVAFAPGR